MHPSAKLSHCIGNFSYEKTQETRPQRSANQTLNIVDLYHIEPRKGHSILGRKNGHSYKKCFNRVMRVVGGQSEKLQQGKRIPVAVRLLTKKALTRKRSSAEHA